MSYTIIAPVRNLSLIYFYLHQTSSASILRLLPMGTLSTYKIQILHLPTSQLQAIAATLGMGAWVETDSGLVSEAVKVLGHGMELLPLV